MWTHQSINLQSSLSWRSYQDHDNSSQFNCPFWMTSRCTSDHSLYRTLAESTCISSHRMWAGSLCHLIIHLDIRACPLLWALLSHRGIQSGLSCMSCKVRELPGLCQCLLASQGIMLATFITVMKSHLHLESKKQTKFQYSLATASRANWGHISLMSTLILKTQTNLTKCKQPTSRVQKQRNAGDNVSTSCCSSLRKANSVGKSTALQL